MTTPTLTLVVREVWLALLVLLGTLVACLEEILVFFTTYELL